MLARGCCPDPEQCASNPASGNQGHDCKPAATSASAILWEKPPEAFSAESAKRENKSGPESIIVRNFVDTNQILHESLFTSTFTGHCSKLSTLPQVMGILNVTPDSFYAGSRTQTKKKYASDVDKSSTKAPASSTWEPTPHARTPCTSAQKRK